VTDVISRPETLTPGPAEALGALLTVPVPDLAGGAGLPPLWHWVYLLDRPAQADLGPDGHQVSQHGVLVVDEEQDIVYREAVTPGTEPAAGMPNPESGPDPVVVPPGSGEREIEVSPVLLFRFSALTYNAHRIHYDRDYCRAVEGYPGLLTHGPLQALAMAMAEAGRAAGAGGDVTFAYRLTSPLSDDQGLVVSAVAGDDGALRCAARNRFGRPTASGTLTAGNVGTGAGRGENR
jgi:3-methylfumaryl-CoA hydratase